jgi:hypothetical protein
VSVVGTLTIGLGAFATVYATVDKVLLEPLPYERPDDLYYVWRDYSWISMNRGWLAGTDVAALDSAGGVIEDAVGLRRNTATLSQRAGGEPEEIGVMVRRPTCSACSACGRCSVVASRLTRVVRTGHPWWCSATTCGNVALPATLRSSAPRFG